MSSSRWRRFTAPAAVIYLMTVGDITIMTASGQDLIQGVAVAQQPGAVNAENFDGKESTEGVYVPESELAMERLALAQKMERLKEWNKSADLYQEILSDPKYASKVVPAKQDADHKVYQYTSVEQLVVQHLARWPDEGLQVYRARYEAQASAQLEQAKPEDLYTLHQIFSRFFATDTGKSAGVRLMDFYLEDGEFRAAASIGDRLLEWHPNIIAERGGILFRTAIAYHLAADDATAQVRLDQLRKRDAEAKGIVRGKQVVLAQALASELKQPVPIATGSTADSYTTFGGDATRDRILAASLNPGAHLYSVSLSKPNWANVPQPQVLEARLREEGKNGMTLGIMPVVDHGELFFQDGQRIYGLSLESGVPLPGWQQTHGSEHNGAYTLPNVTGSPRANQLTLTVTDRHVLAVMGQQDPDLLRVNVIPQGETRLVCLDRQTGKENWLIAPGQLPQESLHNVQFTGAPLEIGDNVLVVAQASKQAGFEDCYVLCFEPGRGKFRWACNVASASTVAAAMMGFNAQLQLAPNVSHLAYANGRVYVQTNHGAVAAIDAYNGTIAWLDIYNRGQQPGMNPQFNPMWFNPGQVPQVQTKPWAFNPVIVSQGMVFTLPLEGKNLLIYDAASGAEIKRIDLDDLAGWLKGDLNPERDEFDTMLAVIGDRLLIGGSRSIVMLNWKTYESGAHKDQMLYWIEDVFNSIQGRPFVTSNSVYVPDSDRLYRMDLKGGMIRESYPEEARSWDENEGPGNVVATSDHVIIASADAVNVYTDLSAATRKLDREVAEAPADPLPRLRYAELMFAAGKYDDSLGRLDEAIQRLGGADSMQPGAARDRVFNDALTFAQKLKGDPRPDFKARVDKLFDRAGAAAQGADQQVHYRIAKARYEADADPTDAVRLYQQVLSDPAMRRVSTQDDSSAGPSSADLIAQKAIDSIARKDPSSYAPFEKEAADALETAQADNNPVKLLEVAQAYPNSTSAAKAMLSAADAFEASGDPHTARRVLLDLFFNHSNTGDQTARLLESLARTDLQIPGYSRGAVKLLMQGVERLHDPGLQKPMKLPDGSEIPAQTQFSAALQRVRKFEWQEQDKALPTFHLPVPHGKSPYPKPFSADPLVIENVDALVVPLREFARTDRVVTWGQNQLSVYVPAGLKPLSPPAALPEAPLAGAWLGNDLLVWGETHVSFLKADAGKLVWTVELSKLPAVEVQADDAAADAAPQANATDMRFRNRVFVNGGGQVVIRNGIVMPAGAVLANAALRPPAGPEHIDHVLPERERVLLTTTAGRVISLETQTGQVAWQARPTERPIDRLVADEDFVCVKLSDEANVRLVVLDTFTGHPRGSRRFAVSSNAVPQNLALSPDGTLVYTLPDRIVLKDLYKPWNEKEIERAVPQGQATFLGASGPDQLIVSEGRILAVTDSGGGDRGEKYVRLYSLETGNPLMLNFGEGQQVERALSADTQSWQVQLRVVGPRLFVLSPDAAVLYNLDRASEAFTLYDRQTSADSDSTVNAHHTFIGTDFVVVVSDPAAPRPVAAGPNPPGFVAPGAVPAPPPAPPAPQVLPEYRLFAFDRSPTKTGESGRLDYDVKIADPAGVLSSWQAVDGGVYYLTADRKLHMLAGAQAHP